MYFEERIQQSLFWKILLKLQKLILILATLVVIFVLGGVVVARYILNVNFMGYDEIILVAAFWMYFIGSSHASYEESHVAVNIVEEYLSPKKALIIAIFSKIMQFLLGIPLIYLSYEMLVWDIEFVPATSDWNIPLLIPQAGIMAGFVIMTFYSFIYILRDYHKLVDGKY